MLWILSKWICNLVKKIVLYKDSQNCGNLYFFLQFLSELRSFLVEYVLTTVMLATKCKPVCIKFTEVNE